MCSIGFQTNTTMRPGKTRDGRENNEDVRRPTKPKLGKKKRKRKRNEELGKSENANDAGDVDQ